MVGMPVWNIGGQAGPRFLVWNGRPPAPSVPAGPPLVPDLGPTMIIMSSSNFAEQSS